MCLLGLCLFYSCYSGKSGFSFKFLMVNIFLKIYSFVITSIVRSLWFSTIVQFPLEWGGMWNVGLNEDQIRQHFCLTDSLTKAGAEWFVNGEKSKTKSYWLAGVKGAGDNAHGCGISPKWSILDFCKRKAAHSVYTVGHRAKISYCTARLVLSVNTGQRCRRRLSISETHTQL